MRRGYSGVPASPGLLQAEIDAIKALGVEIRLGVRLGKDVTLKQLYDESAAVLLAVGAKKARIIPIEGPRARASWAAWIS